MVKIAGIICEYNPLHLGHMRQFALLRKLLGADAAIVCVMSGNYVQRGEPAVFDKFTRSRAAVACGADLILELPLTKAVSSAEAFCRGGVEVLNRLGCVEYLCFGSETGTLDPILKTAELLCSESLDGAIQQQLKTGLSYPAARQRALEQLGGDGTLLRRPNDILAVEYCKALLTTRSRLAPLAIQREGDYHAAGLEGPYPSATAVRAQMAAGQSWLELTPAPARGVFASAAQYRYEAGERAMLARLRGLSDEEFARLPYGAEGLWSKVKTACRTESSVEAVLQAAKSKRYTYSRLKRMLLCGYLGVFQEQLDWQIPYVRILAFSKAGQAVIRACRQVGELELVNAGSPCPDPAYWALERRAADLYSLFAVDDADTTCGMEQAGRVYCQEK